MIPNNLNYCSENKDSKVVNLRSNLFFSEPETAEVNLSTFCSSDETIIKQSTFNTKYNDKGTFLYKSIK